MGVLFLCMILGLRAILTIVLWNHSGGFFLLTGDDASRTAMAYYWSQAPFFNLPGNPAWLPLGTWVHGMALKFLNDPLVTSSVVNSSFSIGSIVVIYRITETLFPEDPFPPVLAAAIVGFSPLLIWLGLSGLSEPIFHFCSLVGVLFWLLANRDKEPRLYVYSSIGFLAASMVRFEAWILVAVFGVFCLFDCTRSKNRLRILGSAAVAGGFIPVWLYWEWYTYGDVFRFLKFYDIHLGESGITQYVWLLWENSPTVVLLALAGIVMSLRHKKGTERYLLFITGFFLGFIMTTKAALTTNFPIRNLTSVFMLLIPYAGYGTYSAVVKLPLARMLIPMIMLAYMSVGAIQSFSYKFQARDELVKTAIWSRHVIKAGLLDEGGEILLEARHGGAEERDVVWDSLFLHAVNPGKIRYDRRAEWIWRDSDWVINESDNPSILDGTAGDVGRRLRGQNVRLVIAYSRPVRKVLDSIMMPIADWKEYWIYTWRDDEFIRKLPALRTGK